MPTPLNWPLLPDPPAPSVPTPGEVSTSQAAANVSRGIPSFLGQGLLRPFRRDQKADFAAGAGIELVKAAVEQILGTKADSVRAPGELPWRTDFGSRLHLLRHQNNTDALRDQARLMSQEALQKWEPRVVPGIVDLIQNGREARLRVTFSVVDRGGRTLLQGAEAFVPVTLAP